MTLGEGEEQLATCMVTHLAHHSMIFDESTEKGTMEHTSLLSFLVITNNSEVLFFP